MRGEVRGGRSVRVSCRGSDDRELERDNVKQHTCRVEYAVF